MLDEPIRVCEWSRVSVGVLGRRHRDALSELAGRWRLERNLPFDPISFEGPGGETLATRQYVGVLAHDGVVVEIYPKLDQHLLGVEYVNESEAGSVLRNLLWVIHVAGMFNLIETGVTSLLSEPSSYIDLFAQLLAVNLRRQFDYGHHRQYVECADDLAILRGRFDVGRQIAQYSGRLDRFVCDFDEFTADTPLNRLFLSACRYLGQIVRDPVTRNALNNCVYLLDEVSDIDPASAVRQTECMVFSRTTERFRPVFELARDLLQGTAPNMGLGQRDTFVFLMDMNKLFEEYVGAVLEERFRTRVDRQFDVGRLLQLPSGGIHQFADFFWKSDGRVWIGDAKYKHLARDQKHALRFRQLDDASEGGVKAGKVIAPDDVRQLSVYAELYRRQFGGEPPSLALLYPFVGDLLEADWCKAWNGSPVFLVPVRLTECNHPSHAIPALDL